MKKHRKYLSTALFSSLCVLALPLSSSGFNDEAHIALSDRATQVSGLDNFLKTVLAFEFPEGIEQVIKDGEKGRVLDLIAQVGAVNEDRPLIRTRHHFHNPTLAWDQAGWRPFLLQLGISSALWSQHQDQVIGGKHSWQDARQSYFDALTSSDASARKGFFADTFRSLGHLIHLIQDAATPSHSRNDAHIISDLFHEWAETLEFRNTIATITPATFSLSFLNEQSANLSAPVPISRLFDTTAGDLGASALGTGDSIGITEYSNANFFSDDTILPETFAFPGLSNLEPASEIDSTTAKKETYLYFKPGFGETNYKLAKASSLRDIVDANVPTDVGLDVKVMQDYGLKLFPRAISYSAGLIDYFFRGLIGGMPTGTDLYPLDSPPTTLTVEHLANDTPNEDTGTGTLLLVLTYGSQNETNETFPQIIVSHPLAATVTAVAQNVTFSFDSLPFPETFGGTVTYGGTVVYRGPLGHEAAAVVVTPLCGSYSFIHGRFIEGPDAVWVVGGCVL